MNSKHIDLLGKHLFLVLLIIGGVVSIVVRLLIGPDEITKAVLAAFICTACLVGYFIKAKGDTTGLHNPDNVYYLGLLFTLISLVYSLASLFIFNSKDDEIHSVHNLIGSFGIALVSTIFGILFRVLLLQEDKPAEVDNIEDLQQLARQDIADAAFCLRKELQQTIVDMSCFRQTIVQATNETFQEFKKTCESITQKMETTMQDQIKMLSIPLEKITGKLNETAELNQQALDKLVNVHVQWVKKSEDIMIRNAERLESNTEESLSRINHGWEQVENVFTAISESLQSDVNNLLNKQNQSMQHLEAVIDQNAEKLASTAQNSLSSIDRNWKNIEHTFNTASKSLKVATDDIRDISQNIRTLINEFNPLNSSIQKTATNFTHAIQEVEKSTVILAEKIIDFSKSIDKSSEVMPHHTRQFEELITRLRQETNQWESMTKQVRSSLIEAIEKLTHTIQNS